MHVLLTNFNQNPAVGLFAFANDRFCLISSKVKENLRSKIEDVLKVPCYDTKILDSDLIGAFVVGNNDVLMIPKIKDDEIKNLKELCEKHDMRLVVFETNLNALGNNIVVGKKGIFANPNYTNSEIEFISQKFNLPVETFSVNEVNAIGSVIKTNPNGCLVGSFAEPYKEYISRFLGLPVFLGTVLNGSPFVSTAIIVNSNGFITSDQNSGIELGIIDEAFGFLGEENE